MRIVASLVLLVACGNAATPETPKGNDPPRDSSSTPTASPVKSSDKVASTPATPSVDDIWKRVVPDLTTCYETGRKAVPEMVDGHIAFVATVDAAGKTTCVVPSDDSGLTADVEDCMRARFERETYNATGAAWSTRIPVQVKDGKMMLGGPTPQTSIDTVESRGLAEDVYTVLDDLLPDVKECVRGAGKGAGRRVVIVGARIAKDGAVACAVASSTSPVPDEARGCLANVFGRAHFKAPKKGIGLLSVPIEITK